ncbi:hypothetical protein AAC387_Pa07g0037 [Persea americana]
MRWNLSSLLSQLVDYQRHSDLDNNGDLKISDFGLGSVVNQVHNNGLLHTIYGTLAYVAPKKEGVSPLPLLFASPPSSSSSPKPTTPPPLSSLLTLPVPLPPIPLQAHSSSAFCLLSLHHLDLPTPTLTSLSDPSSSISPPFPTPTMCSPWAPPPSSTSSPIPRINPKLPFANFSLIFAKRALFFSFFSFQRRVNRVHT